jgi:hypothetical protein
MLPLLLATSFAGVLGSLVTLQKRLQDPRADGDAYYRYIQTSADWISVVLVPPVLGAIFGAIIYLLFLSDLILGGLANWNNSGNPTDRTIAVLLTLGFVAGFAEQLVPDALTRIAQRALSSSNGEPSKTSVTYQAAPSITSINPTSGRSAGGNIVEIEGSGFGTPGLEVRFGAIAASQVTALSDTRITAVAPAGPIATIDVVVTTFAGSSRPSGESRYAYCDSAEAT